MCLVLLVWSTFIYLSVIQHYRQITELSMFCESCCKLQWKPVKLVDGLCYMYWPRLRYLYWPQLLHNYDLLVTLGRGLLRFIVLGYLYIPCWEQSCPICYSPTLYVYGARAALDELGPQGGVGEAGGSTLSYQPNKRKEQSLFQIVCTDAEQMKSFKQDIPYSVCVPCHCFCLIFMVLICQIGCLLIHTD